MDAAGSLLAAVRGAHLIGMLSWFGALLSMVLFAPPSLRRPLQRLARISAVAAAVFGTAWLLLAAASIADTSSVQATIAMLPAVVTGTQFGKALAVRLILLLVALPLGPRLALPPAIVAVALQGLLGHAGAVGGAAGLALLGSEALHLLAAGAWLGGLVPLLLCLARLPPDDASAACERFSPIGVGAVTILAGTAIAQSFAFIETLPGLFGTTYGHAALVKIVLFAAMLLLAARNRLKLTDRLRSSDTARARRELQWSVGLETALGIVVLGTAAFLGSSAPAGHEQPSWPFPVQLNLAALADAGTRNGIALALVAAGASVAAMVFSLRWRRWRIATTVASAGVLGVAWWTTAPLFVPAYPTSFFHSPSAFTATSIVHGETIYAAHCAACHATDDVAKGATTRPIDLAALPAWENTDGGLFWLLSHGKPADGTARVMPGFSARLSETDRWDVIDYLRALDDGLAMRSEGHFQAAIQAPDLPIECADEDIGSLSDLRGKVVRILASDDQGSGSPMPQLPADSKPLVLLKLVSGTGVHPAVPVTANTCLATSTEGWRAYAVLAGTSPDALKGTEFLVDPRGFARAVWRPDGSEAWRGAGMLDSLLQDICSQPISVVSGGAHEHQH